MTLRVFKNNRVRVVSCLLEVAHVDVIMSDADALWLGDPAEELFGRGNLSFTSVGRSDGASGIRDSDIVASRGSFPFGLGRKWGSTVCMGFILFRAKNAAKMRRFLNVMKGLVLETGDDQVSDGNASMAHICMRRNVVNGKVIKRLEAMVNTCISLWSDKLAKHLEPIVNSA